MEADRLSMTAPTRDDDPVHPNFEGIAFFPTTDKTGVIATPASGQTAPVVSYIPLAEADTVAKAVSDVIDLVRFHDRRSYLADYLDDMLEDFRDAIGICRVEAT